MAAKQLPGRSAVHDGLFPSLPDRASHQPRLPARRPARHHLHEQDHQHLLGFPGQSDPSRIAGLASERRGSTHD